uniref:Uncharacterized protein n=1 Tax=Timema tahoe TaxID=61484 RepID=A0A7R9FMQ4_9NEOP|nr:unnamed protein product [Timema tahoe]
MASLVLTDSSQLTSDGFEKLPDQIMVLIGKLNGKRPLGRPKLKWDDNLRIYLKEIGNNQPAMKWCAVVSVVTAMLVVGVAGSPVPQESDASLPTWRTRGVKPVQEDKAAYIKRRHVISDACHQVTTWFLRQSVLLCDTMVPRFKDGKCIILYSDARFVQMATWLFRAASLGQ